MNKSQSLFQTHIEYPEEFHLYDSPDHTVLMELIFIKLLFTLPEFTNNMYRDKDNLPDTVTRLNHYIQEQMFKHADEVLLDIMSEFERVSLDTGFPDYICDFKDEKFLTAEDHYDYVNYEIAKSMAVLHEQEVSVIVHQVAKHLVGVVYAIWRTPDIYDRYRTLGVFDVDVTLDLKSSNIIVMIYSLPALYHDRGETHGC